jgi:hypothetical protein
MLFLSKKTYSRLSLLKGRGSTIREEEVIAIKLTFEGQCRILSR